MHNYNFYRSVVCFRRVNHSTNLYDIIREDKLFVNMTREKKSKFVLSKSSAGLLYLHIIRRCFFCQNKKKTIVYTKMVAG